MNIKQLEYFLSVAQLKSFTKTAEQFFISQTAISQQIKALEHELGVTLLHRNNRIVELTAAGEVFYSDAKNIINNIHASKERVANAAMGIQGSLNVGFLPMHGDTLLADILGDFYKKNPLIEINITDNNITQLYKALFDGQLDVIFTIDYELENYPSIDYLNLPPIPLYAVVNKTHRLSNLKSLPIDLLSEEAFIVISYSNNLPYGVDRLIKICDSGQFVPKIKHKVPSFEAALVMVEAGLGVSVLPNYNRHHHTNVVYIPIEQCQEHVKPIVAWNTESLNPTLNLFLRQLKSTISMLA